ncbi:PREDICTED: 40S ribosomal protein S21-2-like isoform 1 [Fragaria vesca subsp. vesca]
MQNEEGQITELYIPRKCSATNRLITSKDHASVQINIGHLDENGNYTGQFSTFALCGYVRAQVILLSLILVLYSVVIVVVGLIWDSFV